MTTGAGAIMTTTATTAWDERDLRYVERTIARANKIAWAIRAEDLAAFLVANGYDEDKADKIGFTGAYFEEVWELIKS
jgi:hypothetical protein